MTKFLLKTATAFVLVTGLLSVADNADAAKTGEIVLQGTVNQVVDILITNDPGSMIVVLPTNGNWNDAAPNGYQGATVTSQTIDFDDANGNIVDAATGAVDVLVRANVAWSLQVGSANGDFTLVDPAATAGAINYDFTLTSASGGVAGVVFDSTADANNDTKNRAIPTTATNEERYTASFAINEPSLATKTPSIGTDTYTDKITLTVAAQ